MLILKGRQRVTAYLLLGAVCICQKGVSANMEDLAIVLEGVKYHDQLIKSCRVSFMSQAFTSKESNVAGTESRNQAIEGEYFFTDGMLALTQFESEMTLKQVYDKERIMEVYIYEPQDEAAWHEVFYYPKHRFNGLLDRYYSPLFWTEIEGLSLDEIVSLYVKTPDESVQSRGYEMIQGEQCFRLSLIGSLSDMDVIVNLDRGYRIQEIRITYKSGTTLENHTLISVQKVEWEHDKDDIWYPASTYTEIYVLHNQTAVKQTRFREQIQFKDFEANIKIPEDVFLTEPPPGAESVTHF